MRRADRTCMDRSVQLELATYYLIDQPFGFIPGHSVPYLQVSDLYAERTSRKPRGFAGARLPALLW